MRNNRLNSSLDEIDRTILRLLQEDSTLSNAKLAERLSLSVTPCWRRIRRLEEEGFIDGYQANLNRRKLGFGVLAFVQLGFGIHTDDSPNRFEKAILSHPEVLSCHKITGAADYLLQVVAEDLDSYGEFVELVLRAMPGVTSIHSSLALREIKSSSRLPVY
ncbi:Lrp/AsnC family transcriptional regulator [Undibacterium arcticum]|uniref:Lrp/AsnC family transcriptional regulator n=1 Tax=Undibacterium arcticum TaxID=1762892 RepID=A0ABV7F3U5_9BURK